MLRALDGRHRRLLRLQPIEIGCVLNFEVQTESLKSHSEDTPKPLESH